MYDYSQDKKIWAAALCGHFSRATAAQVDAGTVWYQRAAESIAAATGAHWTRTQAAAVAAVLSPRTTWKENLAGTGKLYRAAAQGLRVRPVVAGTWRNVERAWEIAQTGNTALVSGPKVSSFFANILGDYQRVTLDVWAARAAGIPDSLMHHIDRRRYVALESAYQTAAAMCGHSPAQLQAIIWAVVRGNHE